MNQRDSSDKAEKPAVIKGCETSPDVTLNQVLKDLYQSIDELRDMVDGIREVIHETRLRVIDSRGMISAAHQSKSQINAVIRDLKRSIQDAHATCSTSLPADSEKPGG
jgi:phage shock protein A